MLVGYPQIPPPLAKRWRWPQEPKCQAFLILSTLNIWAHFKNSPTSPILRLKEPQTLETPTKNPKNAINLLTSRDHLGRWPLIGQSTIRMKWPNSDSIFFKRASASAGCGGGGRCRSALLLHSSSLQLALAFELTLWAWLTPRHIRIVLHDRRKLESHQRFAHGYINSSDKYWIYIKSTLNSVLKSGARVG